MSTLDRLTVLGNSLALQSPDGQIRPVRLKGVNRSGFQHKRSLALSGMPDPQRELAALAGWGAQIIRFSLAQDFYQQDPAYRADLDRVVQAAAAQGLYLILELHGTTTELSARQAPDGADELWDALARAYGAAPHVAFDLYNEPHDIEWDDWRAQAQLLCRAVRDAGATESLVIVGGLDWSYDLSPLLSDGAALDEDLGPVAYAAHAYPFKGRPAHGPREWDQRFGAAAQRYPVVVSEFGADDSQVMPCGFGDAALARRWLLQLTGYLDARGLSALAWSVGDLPHLCHGAQGRPVDLPAVPPDPSVLSVPFGATVRAWLGGGR